MTIGELAKKAEVNPQTIRYYEREGILPPPRRRYDSGYREYEEESLDRLRFIKQGQSAGLKLSDIKKLFDLEIMPEEACCEVKELLIKRIKELDEKIKELKSFSTSLKRFRKDCETNESGRCAVLLQLRN